MKGKLKIESFVVNPVQAHCFVVSDDSGEAVIIDNGCCYTEEYKALERYVQTESLHVIEQWLTHAHFDHMLQECVFINLIHICIKILEDRCECCLVVNFLAGQLQS